MIAFLGILSLLAGAVNVLKLFRLEASRDMEKPPLTENTRIITGSIIIMLRAVFFVMVAFLLSQW